VLLFYIPFIFGGVVMAKNTVPRLGKPDSTEIIIMDEANTMSSNSESELRSTLNQFYKKSGIVPAVITVEDTKWTGSIENYAYTRYLAEFTDEMHWLIVCSSPSGTSEAMQGNDTDAVLTDYIGDVFKSRLKVDLTEQDMETGAAINDAFNYIMPQIRKPSLVDKIKGLGPALFLFLFVGVHAFFMAGFYELKYRKAVYDPDPNEANQPDQAEINRAGIAAAIAQNYDMNRTLPRADYQNYGSSANGYQNTSYGQNYGNQAGGYMADAYSAGGVQNMNGTQNAGGYMQDAYPSGAQNYGQSSYGAQGSSNGYMQDAYPSAQSYSTPQYGVNSSYDNNGEMPEIGLPQPVPPGCTTCSSCGNVYHVSEGRCPLCGGK
jgi:hypothetical protein